MSKVLDPDNFVVQETIRLTVQIVESANGLLNVKDSRQSHALVAAIIMSALWNAGKSMNENRLHAAVKACNGTSVYRNISTQLFAMHSVGYVQLEKTILPTKTLWELTPKAKELIGKVITDGLPF